MIERSRETSVDLSDILVGIPPMFSPVDGITALSDKISITILPSLEPSQPDLLFVVVLDDV